MVASAVVTSCGLALMYVVVAGQERVIGHDDQTVVFVR
jgi:hypothetical protein